MKAASPCLLWWPQDYLADSNVVDMTLEQEGAYMRLLWFCWTDGSIPGDVARLARRWQLGRSGDDTKKAEALWTALRHLFVEDDAKPGWFKHRRIEEERTKQAERSRRGRDAANHRWSTRGGEASSSGDHPIDPPQHQSRRRRRRAVTRDNGKEEPPHG